MTGMLASIASVAEAGIALDERADIIDAKDPHAGSLGALDTGKVSGIVQAVTGAVPVSATVGDVQPDDPRLLQHIDKMAATGVNLVKVGLFHSQPTERFIRAIQQAAGNKINLVIVLFAEDYLGMESFEPLLQTGIQGILLDTKTKKGKSLPAILPAKVLRHFIETVKSHALLTGLAGSLRYQDIETLLGFAPDYLGFRGALCAENSRTSRIDRRRVKKIRAAIPQRVL